MINKKLETALNKQINEEIFSAYLYLSMAAYFLSLNLDGFAAWMKSQAQEEMSHAMKFFNFLDEMGGRVSLLAVKEPVKNWKSPLAAFTAVSRHEQYITNCINELYRLAGSEKNNPTQIMLQWFIKEQVEEESTAAKIVFKLTQIKDSVNGMWILDKQLGARGTGA
ncbi:MAG: ferritin [Candidatus Aminicenantes bacterium]|nr:ferritin [Candidatus Aminicenantes bacterium]